MLSRTQAGPGRTVKKEQEEISPNHVQRLNVISVVCLQISAIFRPLIAPSDVVYGSFQRVTRWQSVRWKTALSPPVLPYSPERGENGFETVSVGVMSQIMASSEKTSWRGEIVLGEGEKRRVHVSNGIGG